jgi:hypothetical protein
MYDSNFLRPLIRNEILRGVSRTTAIHEFMLKHYHYQMGTHKIAYWLEQLDKDPGCLDCPPQLHTLLKTAHSEYKKFERGLEARTSLTGNVYCN